jgi:uncharacterized protein
METATGMKEAPPMVEEKPEWWASPAVVGLMGFGTTTMLAGLSNLPLPYGAGFGAGGNPIVGNWTVFGMALAFGGIAQLIAGLIALRKGNMFAGSAFMGYGSFWLAFTFMINGWLIGAATAGSPVAYGVAGFAFIWMLFTFSFLINAPKHGWGILLVFLFLFIAFILLVVKFYSLAASAGGCTSALGCGPFAADAGANWAVGGEIIFDGFLAWYVATADLTNWNYGRRVLPV